MLKTLKKLPLIVALATLTLQTVPALADPYDDHDRREDRMEERHEERRAEERHEERREEERRDARMEERRGPPRMGAYFAEHERAAVYEYYGRPRKVCPPGLIPRAGHCIPAGPRAWQMGRPLPRGVVYQPVEPEVAVHLGPPPAGHQFVRVAGDILLLAIGTATVVDAIQDIQGR